MTRSYAERIYIPKHSPIKYDSIYFDKNEMDEDKVTCRNNSLSFILFSKLRGCQRALKTILFSKLLF